MFLRKNRKRSGGEYYEYWTLCETVRTERGPRQRVVASLGKLSEEDLSAGWEDIEALLEGRAPSPRQGRLGEKSQNRNGKRGEAQPRWELADLSQLSVERVREFGRVYLALALWRRLGLHELLGELMEGGRESIPWSEVAAVLTAGKFCGVASELSLAQEWYGRTAMEDLTGIDAQLINDDRLYRGLDALGAHKDRLCEHLMERYRDWFGVRFEFLLYDVTSTYFEGAVPGNEQAARGYSRDNRSDCKQVCIGLVCTPEGLPLNFEIFRGNRTDVTTVEEIVSKMEDRFGQADRIWVMDRGMVSEKNIDFLRARKAHYIVGTPKASLRHFQVELAEQENWVDVQDGPRPAWSSTPTARATSVTSSAALRPDRPKNVPCSSARWTRSPANFARSIPPWANAPSRPAIRKSSVAASAAGSDATPPPPGSWMSSSKKTRRATPSACA